MPEPARRATAPPAAPGGPDPRPLMALAGLLLAGGAVVSLSFLVQGPLQSVALGWAHWTGWLAVPLAFALFGCGVALWRRGPVELWQLPWGRALAVELALASTLVLLAAALGPRGPGEQGPGGLAGWGLLSASSQAIGRVPAILAWLAVGSVAVILAFRIGTHQIAGGLERLADWLGMEAGPAPAAVIPTSAGATVRRDEEPAAPARPVPAARRRSAPAATPAAAPRSPAPAAPPARPARRPAGAARLPDLALLASEPERRPSEADLAGMAETLQQTLAGFGVPVEVVSVERGPAVTRFGVKPGMTTRAGRTMRVKVSSILALRSDLALALAVPAVRVEAPVPGQAMVGIEVPNSELRAVALRGVLEDRGFKQLRRASTLALALGRDVSGAAVVADLAVMPHLLIAGTTGSGKSICINAVLASLLFQNTPDSLRLLLVDPKRVELARFGRLPHLIAPVVTDPREAVGALRWVVQELERRYRRLAEQGVRDRAGYNARLAAGQAPMAALVVVIDELADLMLTAAGDTEPALMRLAQLGRATGLHLIVATQRPSTDVITGVIKANFPARIAFAVASGTDSRVILDTPGAERLLGRGDMLFLAPEAPAPRRVQGVLVGDEELGRLVGFWAAASGPPPGGAVPWQELVPPASPDEALYEAARALARSGQPVTASLLARRLRIGHARARALFDRLIEEGEIDDSAGEADGGDLGTNLSWVDDEFEGRP